MNRCISLGVRAGEKSCSSPGFLHGFRRDVPWWEKGTHLLRCDFFVFEAISPCVRINPCVMSWMCRREGPECSVKPSWKVPETGNKSPEALCSTAAHAAAGVQRHTVHHGLPWSADLCSISRPCAFSYWIEPKIQQRCGQACRRE